MRRIYRPGVCGYLLGISIALSTSLPAGAAPPGEFRVVGSLSVTRVWSTATLLASGKVLVAGGWTQQQNRNVSLASCELFNPTTDRFTATGRMQIDRMWHTAVRLRDDRVLILGGQRFVNGRPSVTRSAEIYDPATETFTRVGDLTESRLQPQSVLLRDGRVFIVGGDTDDSGVATPTAEIFDPTTGKFQRTGSMAAARRNYAAVLLPDGRVAVLGGVPAVEIYDPATGQFIPRGELPEDTVGGVYGTTAHLLSDGTILVVGGITDAIQIYDPRTSQTRFLGTLRELRPFAISVALPDGKILIAGGTAGPEEVFSTSELIDPATGFGTPAASFPNAAPGRIAAGAALLQDGRVLIAGGSRPNEFLSSAVVYVP
jgi:hypothetical protein